MAYTLYTAPLASVQFDRANFRGRSRASIRLRKQHLRIRLLSAVNAFPFRRLLIKWNTSDRRFRLILDPCLRGAVWLEVTSNETTLFAQQLFHLLITFGRPRVFFPELPCLLQHRRLHFTQFPSQPLSGNTPNCHCFLPTIQPALEHKRISIHISRPHL